MLNGKESDISGEETTCGLDYVWDWGKDGKWKFAKIPYAIIWSIMNGQLTLMEIKVLLYLCRMAFGFKSNKGVTKELSVSEFQKYTNIAPPHLSKIIPSLIRKGFILRSRPLGGRSKFSINLKPFGDIDSESVRKITD